jgi:hypothetical protein
MGLGREAGGEAKPQMTTANEAFTAIVPAEG